MQATPSVADIEPAGSRAASALLTIADALAAADFEARSPIWEGSAYMKITNARGALSDLTITADGTVTWDYRTRDGRHINPDQITGIVLDLLRPASDQHPAATRAHHADLTLKGNVGRTLAGHGLQVTLELIGPDHDFYEAYAEVQVTNPAHPARGTACITDDGDLSWQCTTRPAEGITLTEIAATLARALTRAQHTPCHA